MRQLYLQRIEPSLRKTQSSYDDLHHPNDDNHVVYIPTDNLVNYFLAEDFDDNNECGDQVSVTNHHHGDHIPDYTVHTEVECHYVDDDGKTYDRVLIEWCCGPHSLLGQPSAYSNGCKVVRLTIDDDFRTTQGLASALRMIRKRPKGRTLLWSAMPCAGGSPWQTLNIQRGVGLGKIDQHWADFRLLWDSFLIAAKTVMDTDGVVTIEWPARCKSWRDLRVLDFLKKYKFVSNVLHGCDYGLKAWYNAPIGQPLKKPWRGSSNKNEMLSYLDLKCDEHHFHGVCRGKDCTVSEEYANDVADAIHKGFKICCDAWTIHNDDDDRGNLNAYDDVDNAQMSDSLFHSNDNSDHITRTTYYTHTLGKLDTSFAGSYYDYGGYAACISDYVNSLGKFDTHTLWLPIMSVVIMSPTASTPTTTLIILTLRLHHVFMVITSLMGMIVSGTLYIEAHDHISMSFPSMNPFPCFECLAQGFAVREHSLLKNNLRGLQIRSSVVSVAIPENNKTKSGKNNSGKVPRRVVIQDRVRHQRATALGARVVRIRRLEVLRPMASGHIAEEPKPVLSNPKVVTAIGDHVAEERDFDTSAPLIERPFLYEIISTFGEKWILSGLRISWSDCQIIIDA
jgi:hypothetical protein